MIPETAVLETTETDIRETLAKLRIGSGGKPLYRTLPGAPEWEISLQEYSQDSNAWAVCVIRVPPGTWPSGRCETRALLRREDLETRSRHSIWRRDATWRLTPAAIDTLTTSLLGILARLRDGETPILPPKSEPR